MTPRCYTTAQICRELSMARRTFFALKRAGRLPFLEELRPRLGRVVRYRAEPVDRYLANRSTRSFGSARKSA